MNLQTSRDRCDAFPEALQAVGILAESVTVVEGNLRVEGGQRAAHSLLRLAPLPTAVFTANDLTAMGLLTELRAQGLRVPDDLSIIGLDDIWIAAHTEPALTTVALPRYQIGQLATRMLLDRLETGDMPSELERVRQVYTRLVIRRSTGAIRV